MVEVFKNQGVCVGGRHAKDAFEMEFSIAVHAGCQHGCRTQCKANLTGGHQGFHVHAGGGITDDMRCMWANHGAAGQRLDRGVKSVPTGLHEVQGA